MSADIRELIREVLSEELKKMVQSQGQRIKRESVSINNDSELNRFVISIVKQASNPDFVQDVLDGKHIFALEQHVQQSTAQNRTVQYTQVESE